MDYQEYFQKATGHKPFPYQIALVEELPAFLAVPTGAGKTDAVIVSWLYKRRILNENLPRRLVYCLPMRTLVEQTYEKTCEILTRLGYGDIPVHVVMGGEKEEEWYLDPAVEQIIIGTQDMLISRALNRGYAVSRFQWPIHFGLLNNDCFWIFDELQLMGSTVATSAQLEALRKEFGTLKSCQTLWMSATLEKDWLATVDHKKYLSQSSVIQLSSEDKENHVLEKRMNAGKTLFQLEKNKPKDVARHIVAEHQKGNLTLVIVNQVKRAVDLYKEIEKIVDNEVEIVLIHSRFRPIERKMLMEKLNNLKDGIIISTQVVEAGVDISSRILFTDLAPYPSLVQRFGRLNRYGEFEDSKAYWINLENKDISPYTPEEMDIARNELVKLEGKSIAPNDLPKLKLNLDYNFVIRKNELMELYDTSSDLFGADLDVSRFIRETDDLSVQVFWRDFNDKPDSDISAPSRDELCPASISEFRDFMEEKRVFVWEPIDKKWQFLHQRRLRPGLIILANAEDGGYDEDLGFNIKSKDRVKVLDISGVSQEGMEDDRFSHLGWWESLESHAKKAEIEMNNLCKALDIEQKLCETLNLAAKLHDIGKAHIVFQNTMERVAEKRGEEFNSDEIWAKSPNANIRHSQRYFRHEMASALILLQNRDLFEGLDEESFQLIVYLIACHHGKVRVSMKSMPKEIEKAEVEGIRVSRGIKEGSKVGPIYLGNLSISETLLNLEPIELGSTDNYNWLDLSLGLLEEYGPFVLAYLEALLRVADVKASKKEGRVDV